MCIRDSEDTAELTTEITDYHSKPEMNNNKQGTLQFLIIDKIKFRSIDTGNLLRAVELKQIPLTQQVSESITNYEINRDEVSTITRPIEKTFFKIMKVPF